MRLVGRKSNADYRVREHLTESEMDRLLGALKANRHGHRDWLIGLLIYRHGLRVSERVIFAGMTSIWRSGPSSFDD
jgi:site-specific recombinase XerD